MTPTVPPGQGVGVDGGGEAVRARQRRVVLAAAQGAWNAPPAEAGDPAVREHHAPPAPETLDRSRR